MLQFFRRLSPPAPPALSPLDRTLSLWLAIAHVQRASAIVIGMPRDLPRDLEADATAAFREGPWSDPLRTPQGPSDARGIPWKSSRLRSTVGWQTVPVWMKIDGRLHPHYGVPIGMHLHFLSVLQEHLVSLGTSEEDRKAVRYIEYSEPAPPRGPAERRFAEVELWLDEDNTVRIEILGHRHEPASVQPASSIS